MQHNEAQPLEQGNRDQDAPSLGQILKRARERQGLTLGQACAELRFEERLLEALEDDHLDELGAPVFAKGYIKQYGQLLGLPYDDLLMRYYDAVGKQEVVIEPSRTIKLRDERQIAVWVIAGLALLLIGVALFVWWTRQAAEPVAFPPPAESPGAVPGEPRPPPLPPADRSSAGESREGGVVEGGAEPPAPTAETGGAGAQTSARSPAGPEAAGAADEAAGGEEPIPAAPDAESAGVPASVDDGALLPPGPRVRVELVFTQDSWVELVDARGERIVYGLMRAGQRTTATGVPPVAVLLGNADGVRVAVDGEPFAVPSAGRRGDVAEFTVAAPGN